MNQETERELYFYPPNTVGSNSDGYFHRLDNDQKEALSSLQTWSVDNNVDIISLSVHTLHPTLTLLRYLRANNFVCDKAIAHILTNIKWREKMNVKELVKMSPEDILGCPMTLVTEVFPHWHSGFDMNGRPVLYKQYGKFDVGKLNAITSTDAVMNYHIWEQEACLRMCVAQSHKRGMIIETCSAVLDVQDMTLRQVTSEFLALVKGIAAIDKDQVHDRHFHCTYFLLD
jgi:hypothetical protein